MKYGTFCGLNGHIRRKNTRNHEPTPSGSHEVSGSIPLISTKTKSHSVRNGFLFWLGICGARSAVVRPNVFLRRKSAAFSAYNAENIRKCNRHGGGAAAGVSRLSFHFPFSKISRISLVMRPDPDLTQTGRKRGGFIEIYLTKQHEHTIFQSFSEYFNGGCNLQPPLWFWGQIAFRMVFPIASAALCFIPGVE